MVFSACFLGVFWVFPAFGDLVGDEKATLRHYFEDLNWGFTLTLLYRYLDPWGSETLRW